jgi:hypothetical protein
VALRLSVRISVVLMKQRPYVVREKVYSAPLTQEETVPQGRDGNGRDDQNSGQRSILLTEPRSRREFPGTVYFISFFTLLPATLLALQTRVIEKISGSQKAVPYSCLSSAEKKTSICTRLAARRDADDLNRPRWYFARVQGELLPPAHPQRLKRLERFEQLERAPFLWRSRNKGRQSLHLSHAIHQLLCTALGIARSDRKGKWDFCLTRSSIISHKI